MAWQLEPMHEMFFVWPDLIKSMRELYWSVADSINLPRSSSLAQHYEPIKLTKSGNDKYKFMVPNTAPDNHSAQVKFNENDQNGNIVQNLKSENITISK